MVAREGLLVFGLCVYLFIVVFRCSLKGRLVVKVEAYLKWWCTSLWSHEIPLRVRSSSFQALLSSSVVVISCSSDAFLQFWVLGIVSSGLDLGFKNDRIEVVFVVDL
ncbi:unnamed protein product [Arabis nemorensis]|uniref:Uncharacterized protein n=1 Tax=Arabis nemorensis TaxID=586526 RepID=A0A565BWC3_9BRAS|nr:unnamed protein product [Arabis nemorensis]